MNKIPGLSEHDRDIRLSELYALLGKVYLDTKRLDKAEDHLRKSLEIRITKLPKENKDIWRSKIELGICLFKKKKYLDAEALLLSSLEYYKKTHPEETEQLARLYDYSVKLYETTGDKEKAKKYAAQLESFSQENNSKH